MHTRQDDDDEIVCVPVELLLSRRDINYLVRLHRLAGETPGEMISSMFRDIRIDDEREHGEDRRGRPH